MERFSLFDRAGPKDKLDSVRNLRLSARAIRIGGMEIPLATVQLTAGEEIDVRLKTARRNEPTERWQPRAHISIASTCGPFGESDARPRWRPPSRATPFTTVASSARRCAMRPTWKVRSSDFGTIALLRSILCSKAFFRRRPKASGVRNSLRWRSPPAAGYCATTSARN